MILIVGKTNAMLYKTTLFEIVSNVNPGIEYEIALFYKMLQSIKPQEAQGVFEAIQKRPDREKVKAIIGYTNAAYLSSVIQTKKMTLKDVSFETQNDEVGPADLIMHLVDSSGCKQRIGLSVKYANTCTLNVTGRNFITDKQVASLKALLPQYTNLYIKEMSDLYGDVSNWFRQRKPSKTTDAFIDKIRDAVIENWPSIQNKDKLLEALFHSDSPIEFWVITYGKSNYAIQTVPTTIERKHANDVTVRKMETSYVAFYLDGKRIGHMQVKFNNGFVEKCKKSKPDVVYQGVAMAYGQPFSSWNFSVEK